MGWKFLNDTDKCCKECGEKCKIKGDADKGDRDKHEEDDGDIDMENGKGKDAGGMAASEDPDLKFR